MGAWGYQPLENDTALDWMSDLIDMDSWTLASTLQLLCKSIDETEAVLGAFIIDTYNNGLYSTELSLYEYGDWFNNLYETTDAAMFHQAYGEYAAICRVIDNGAENWVHPDERLKELNLLKTHIKNGKRKEKN